ncbi:Zn-dependent hydrolase glyoxalase II family protein [Betaproteobacteria bacterium]|nr:Zn-dependent hydrolase glyoxalase II family protein [Betaproteobacteria bacterium]GHU48493.1 Zn-dependent hydrolase glyoxalase II family protein [Betaproteobacteria bacterium]
MRYKIVPVTPLEQNCTLFWCESTRQAAVVDPGGDVARIVAALEAEQLTPTLILITHGHFDHAGGAAELATRYNIPIEGPHEADRFWIDGIADQGRKFGLAGGQTFTPDRWLGDGDTVAFGEVTLEVLHCPGHTPGHVVYYSRPDALLQVGDVLFQGSIGRTDFPQGNHADILASIRQKLFPLGDDIQFIPGHGPMSTLGDERQWNPFVGDGR